MPSNISFSVIGGDLRHTNVANYLAADGYDVTAFAVDYTSSSKKVTIAGNLINAVSSCSYIILPMPLTIDSISVNSPFYDGNIYIKDVILNSPSNAIVFAGQIPNDITCLAKTYNIKIIDYLLIEDLATLNAIPTAEGAIQIAMENTPFTIHNSKCLITGYGRIGKMLASRLKALGADVTVSARKASDFALIDAASYNYIFTGKISQIAGNRDIIFNTIPYPVFDKKVLSKIKEHTLIIDLASKPGGVDFDASAKLGIKTIRALSLPGKVAPLTAAKIIKDTIINITKEIAM